MGARLARLVALAGICAGLAIVAIGCNGDDGGGEDLAPRASVARCYLDAGGTRLTLASGCTLRTQSGSTVNLASGTTLTGQIAPSAGYGGLAVWATSVPIAAVDATPVAPLGLLQPVSMATAGTMPITIPAAGQVICLWNTGSQAVSVDDTSTQVLNSGGTPIALGQYDMLCGISDGTRFIQFATSNN